MMIHRLHLPAPPLERFVENFWFYAGYKPDHTIEKLLPDGAVEVVIDLTEPPKRLHDPVDLSRYREMRRAWISGMRTEYLVIGAELDSSMIGIRFRTEGAAPFIPFPASEIANRVVELDQVWGLESRLLREAILESRTITAKFRILERFLLRIGRHRLEPRPEVTYALKRLGDLPGPIRVREVADEIGMSQKHLIMLFERHVGLKPKGMHRVLRFLRALEEIEGRAEVDWAMLALDCGFYDQSHFIREFQAFSGITPTAYAEKRGDLRYYIPLDRR